MRPWSIHRYTNQPWTFEYNWPAWPSKRISKWPEWPEGIPVHVNKIAEEYMKDPCVKFDTVMSNSEKINTRHYEKDGKVTFELDVPGYGKDDVTVEYTEQTSSLTITCDREGKEGFKYTIDDIQDYEPVDYTVENGVVTVYFQNRKDLPAEKPVKVKMRK